MTKSRAANEVIVGCIQAMLVPVVRLCLKNSLKLHELLEMIKIAFVRAADQELKSQGKEPSLSKISVMSGVHRKDVTRISRTADAYQPQDNIVAKVMAQWQVDSRFTTKAGKPRVLGVEGGQSEFAQLVESVNGGNVSSYTVLFEMERMGIVSRRADTVQLQWQDYAPEPSAEQGLDMLASDAQDLFQAVEENIYDRDRTPNLHLKTVMDNITSDSVPEIRKGLLEMGSAFHRQVREYLGQFDRDINPGCAKKRGGVRVALGTFSLVVK